MRRSVYGLIIVLLSYNVGMLFAGAKPEQEANLNLDASPRVYIAPRAQGINLDVPLSNLIDLPQGLEIKRYEFNIFNTDGELVFTEKAGQERQRGAFGSIKWKGAEVKLPDNLSWNGSYGIADDPRNGQDVPDGDYSYQVIVIDSRGNEIESPPLGVTIDNTKPEILSFLPTINLVFSPDGNRVKDTVIVRQISTRELRWEIRISDAAGNLVYEDVQENTSNNILNDVSLPQEYVWDGRDMQGQVQPEGEYQYIVTGTDRAGNTFETALPRNIIISYTAEFATIEPEDGVAVFSPNDDGVRDVMNTTISLYEEEGISNWAISVVSVFDPSTTLLYQEGEAPVIDAFSFDGKDASGKIIPDGDYIIVLGLFDGSQEIATSELYIRVDTTPPRLGVELTTLPVATAPGDPFYFGGKDRNTVVFSVIGENGVDWKANIKNETDNTELVIPLSELGMQKGRLDYKFLVESEAGRALTDGKYVMVVDGYDKAGNYGASTQIRAIKDTRLGTVNVEVDGMYLAPGSPGDTATVPIRVDRSITEGAAQFLLEIKDSTGKIVRSVYKRQFYSSFDWDGFTNNNTVALDGEYTVTYRVLYYNGNAPQMENVGPIIVDAQPPVIQDLNSEWKFFSPDGDSVRDVITIQQKVVPDPEIKWVGEVIDASGEVLRSFDFGETVEEKLTWDGKDDDDVVLGDGDYLYILRGQDIAGNVTEKRLPIIIGASGGRRWVPAVDIQITPQPFSPDGDGVNDEVTINISARRNSGIKSWKLDILDRQDNVFISFPGGTGDPNEKIIWDGFSEDGELVQAADDYKVVITAVDLFDNVGTIESTITTDILVIEEDGRIRIRIPSIYFAGFLSDLLLVQDDQLESNLSTVRRLERILNRYPEHKILIEGHAAHIFWQDEERMEREHEEVLLPLSRARAENVRRALIILGVARNRMRIEGFGGSMPVVDHGERKHIWKNRRVEFILDTE